jgi:parvulin-like peptidyl-prolyl isomerase
MSLNSFKKKISSGPLAIVLFAVVVLCVGVLAFTGIGQSISNNRDQNSSGPKETTDVVATVNKIPITLGAYESAVTTMKEQAAAYGQPATIASAAYIRAQAFDQLVQPILIAQIAGSHGLSVSSDELATVRTKALGELASKLGLPASASESDVSTALQGMGHTIDDYVNENSLKNQLLVNKYRDYLMQANQASEDKVKQYFQQSKVRDILIDNVSRPDAQAKALAANLISRLDNGANFSQLAKQYSDDKATKDKGGDLGVLTQSSSYPPEFKTATLALKSGQVSPQPVLVPGYGYYVFQCESVTSALPKDYQKNHAQYVAQVTEALATAQMESELAADKAKAAIVPLDPRLKADLELADAKPGASLQSALADYNAALKTADDSDKAEIYASEAQIYQLQAQPDKEIAALNSALGIIEDGTLRMMLGDLYRQRGDKSNALKQYQIASQNAFDNPDIHVQLMQDYRILKQPKLAAAETARFSQYTARQKQANAQPGGQTP